MGADAAVAAGPGTGRRTDRRDFQVSFCDSVLLLIHLRYQPLKLRNQD